MKAVLARVTFSLCLALGLVLAEEPSDKPGPFHFGLCKGLDGKTGRKNGVFEVQAQWSLEQGIDRTERRKDVGPHNRGNGRIAL